jgi:general secretion pathway protein K
MNTPIGQSAPIGQNLTGQNNAFTIVSEAFLADGSRALISAVIKKSANTQATPSPFEILKWQNATANRASLFTDAMSNLLVKQYAEPELNN